MTRINVGIPVKCLTDEHLLAEHREIKRLPSCFIKAMKSGALNRIPNEFCLGNGHVTFFLDKFNYTLNRYIEVHNECINRGFNVLDYSTYWNIVEDSKYWKSYKPKLKDKSLIINRIAEKIIDSKKDYFHYYGNRINKDKAIELLKNN